MWTTNYICILIYTLLFIIHNMHKHKYSSYITLICVLYTHIDQGSDKGGGVVQMVLVDTKRNA